MRSLINTSTNSSQGSGLRCKPPIRKHAKLLNDNCPPTPGGTPHKMGGGGGGGAQFFPPSPSSKNAPLSPSLGSSPMYHFYSETSSTGKNAPQSPNQVYSSPRKERKSPSFFNPGKTMVRVESFASFCMDNGGLFEGFIHITDPATQVLCLGSIEEDPQLRANGEAVVDDSDITPLPPRSIGDLHGIKVLQVCCGGEHAVVLGEGGYVYTWGKGGFGRCVVMLCYVFQWCRNIMILLFY